MGKGTIISGGDSGLYQVQLNYARTQYDNEIARIDDSVTYLETKIAENPGDKVLRAQKFSLEKRKKYIIANMPDDETIAAWCADLTENLTGEVGIIEIPGESVEFNIQPGYGGNAAYATTRDGQLVPTISMNPEQAFYNLAMLPGWQKWKPLTRYATITALSGDIADVTLSSAESSQQGLAINQESTIEDVPVDYMDCNGAAFEVGDEVLVEFEGQDFASPKIIGFKSDPVPCGLYLYIEVNGEVDNWSFDIYKGNDVTDIVYTGSCLPNGVGSVPPEDLEEGVDYGVLLKNTSSYYEATTSDNATHSALVYESDWFPAQDPLLGNSRHSFLLKDYPGYPQAGYSYFKEHTKAVYEGAAINKDNAYAFTVGGENYIGWEISITRNIAKIVIDKDAEDFTHHCAEDSKYYPPADLEHYHTRYSYELWGGPLTVGHGTLFEHPNDGNGSAITHSCSVHSSTQCPGGVDAFRWMSLNARDICAPAELNYVTSDYLLLCDSDGRIVRDTVSQSLTSYLGRVWDDVKYGGVFMASLTDAFGDKCSTEDQDFEEGYVDIKIATRISINEVPFTKDLHGVI